MEASGHRRLGACAAFLIIATRAWALPGVLSAPGPAMSIAPSPEATGPARLHQAVLNVHAYVEKRKAPFSALFRNVTTMSIVDAAKEVVASHDQVSLVRRRLLATRLLAYARDDSEAVRAVQELIGVENTAAVLALLRAPARPRQAAAGDTVPSSDPEAAVNAAMTNVMKKTPLMECSDWQGVPYIGWSGGNDVSISILADGDGQTIKAAEKGIDPQSWHDCAPDLWRASYLAQMNGDRPVPGPDGDPLPGTPQTPGSEYAGTLFEHFVCGPGEPCALKVLLDVFTRLPSMGPDYYMRFQNPRQLGGSPAVLIDYGWISAWKRQGGGVSAHAEKTLGFADSATAGTVYYALNSIDVSIRLAQLICCKK